MNPGDVLRAVRRDRRLSQRELAELVGVPRSTIDRVESGASMRPSLALMERILDATGYQLTVCTKLGYPVDVADGRLLPLDRGGRLYPAHLRLRRVGLMGDQPDSPGYWWGWWHKAFWDRDPKKPTYTFDRRFPRDPSRNVDWEWSEAT